MALAFGKTTPTSHSAGYAFSDKRREQVQVSSAYRERLGRCARSLDAAASHGSHFTLAIGRHTNAKAQGFHAGRTGRRGHDLGNLGGCGGAEVAGHIQL